MTLDVGWCLSADLNVAADSVMQQGNSNRCDAQRRTSRENVALAAV